MTELLDEYIKKIERQKEKKRLEALRDITGALNNLSKDFSFNEAYIFGSILKKKRFYKDSDIDIAVSGLDDKDFFHFMARLYEILGRDVDVIQLENNRLKNKIVKEGLLWKKEG